ncbi:hypothetical protein [Streptomyces sp. NPDC058451]|uniref:hypothetical protein n=1 Tax=Streptomyces sp. NPDC058451 TaxID=3346506 RepID=UPI00365E09FE
MLTRASFRAPVRLIDATRTRFSWQSDTDAIHPNGVKDGGVEFAKRSIQAGRGATPWPSAVLLAQSGRAESDHEENLLKTDQTLLALILAVAILSAAAVGAVALMKPRVVPALTLAVAVGFGVATLLLATS